jgi:hypothetical protein
VDSGGKLQLPGRTRLRVDAPETQEERKLGLWLLGSVKATLEVPEHLVRPLEQEALMQEGRRRPRSRWSEVAISPWTVHPGVVPRLVWERGAP